MLGHSVYLCGCMMWLCCVFVAAESRESSSRSTAPRTDSAPTSRHAVGTAAPSSSSVTAAAQFSSDTISSHSSAAAAAAAWSSGSSAAANATKQRASMTSSRREELLQQLKAVEDAIAKKRSKMNWCGSARHLMSLNVSPTSSSVSQKGLTWPEDWDWWCRGDVWWKLISWVSNECPFAFCSQIVTHWSSACHWLSAYLRFF